MTNAELISMVRSIAKHGADWRMNEVLNRAADALEAADKRIAELEKSYAWKAYSALEESIEGYKTRIAELDEEIIYWQTYAQRLRGEHDGES